MFYKSILKPLLFHLDGEQAHDLTLKSAKKIAESKPLQNIIKKWYGFKSAGLQQNILGLTFDNPIGLAAGFDKNGEIPSVMQAAGFGFVEIGSITAKASAGNPKPRAFRLPEDQALINRMGLNNDGAESIINRLKDHNLSIPLGINIAKTHDSAITGKQAIADYVTSYRQAQKVANYITVNISCPNTKTGKTFEYPAALRDLLSALKAQRTQNSPPWLVKFSPDLVAPSRLIKLLDICESHEVDGYVACNTSSDRDRLQTDPATLKKIGRGGLSGAPLASKAIQTVYNIRQHVGDQKPIIGVGGIDSFTTAMKMLLAGANLLQIYTGFIYEGPGLIKRINQQLAGALDRLGLDNISQLSAND